MKKQNYRHWRDPLTVYLYMVQRVGFEPSVRCRHHPQIRLFLLSYLPTAIFSFLRLVKRQKISDFKEAPSEYTDPVLAYYRANKNLEPY